MEKKNWKTELSYFLHYFKWPVLAGLIILFLVLHFVSASLSQKKTVLSVMLLDCHASAGQEQMAEAFGTGMEIDPKKEKIEVQSSLMLSDTFSGSYAMTSLSRFMTEVGNKNLDVCGMLLSDYEKYDASATWMDLRNICSKDWLAKMKAFWIESEDGRIIGIDPAGLPGLQAAGCYDESGGPASIGIVYNTQRPDASLRFLEFLSEETDI